MSGDEALDKLARADGPASSSCESAIVRLRPSASGVRGDQLRTSRAYRNIGATLARVIWRQRPSTMREPEPTEARSPAGLLSRT